MLSMEKKLFLQKFKAAGHKVVFLSCPRDNAEVLDFARCVKYDVLYIKRFVAVRCLPLLL